MRLTPFLLSILLLPAQAAFSQSMEDVLDELQANRSIGQISFADLDGDGDLEALVALDSPCEYSICPWVLVDQVDENIWGIVSAGSAASVSLVPTSGDVSIIRSDGVILSWDGFEMTPFFDILDGLDPRRPTSLEARQMSRDAPVRFRSITTDLYDIGLVLGSNFGVMLHERPDERMTDAGSMPAIGQFVILSPQGELLNSGRSETRPLLYLDEDGAGQVLRIVTRENGVMTISTLGV